MEGAEDDERAFLQERIVLFAKTVAALFGAIVFFIVALLPITPASIPKDIGRIVLFLVPSSVVLLAVWATARYRVMSRAQLRATEVILMATAGLATGGTSFTALETPAQVSMPFALGVIILFARVFTIPSSAFRTFWLAC